MVCVCLFWKTTRGRRIQLNVADIPNGLKQYNRQGYVARVSRELLATLFLANCRDKSGGAEL